MRKLLWFLPLLLGVSPAMAQVSAQNMMTQTATLQQQPQLLASSSPALGAQASCAVPASGNAIYVTAITMTTYEGATPATAGAGFWTIYGPPGFGTAVSPVNFWPTTYPATAGFWAPYTTTGSPVLFKVPPGSTGMAITSPVGVANVGWECAVFGYTWSQ